MVKTEDVHLKCEAPGNLNGIFIHFSFLSVS